MFSDLLVLVSWVVTMDDVSNWKGAAERSFCQEEEKDVEVDNPIADDFGCYGCFMQPFYSPDKGDEQTKELEMECFDKIDKNNSDHKVTIRFFDNFFAGIFNNYSPKRW